jgi:predicted dehydrogenase
MFRTNRRGFLGASAAAGALALGAATTTNAQDPKTLRMGIIGVGWYGMVDAKAALKAGGVEIAAVCDVDSDHLQKAADDLEQQQGNRPQTFKSYEQLLDMKPALDVVVIATPPQWHALQLIAAVDRGLDVYCEKPVSYDIREGRAMVDAVEKSGRIVQVGFQRRQSAAFQQAAQFIRDGGIGQLVQVDAQIHYTAGTKDNTPQDPPASLDWDLWCGPGPLIPYSPQVGHKSWRLEQTSGHGHLVDWGIHLIDTTRYLLGLGMPNKITAAGGLYAYADKITTPDTLSVQFDFDNLPVHWRHRLWGATEYDPSVNNGIFFFGDKGTVFATDRKWTFLPRGARQEREEHEADADMGTLHMADFLDAVRERRPPTCPISEGFPSTATVQLGMISYESGTTVNWDAQQEQILDNPAASALLKREYREPYVHPFSA